MVPAWLKRLLSLVPLRAVVTPSVLIAGVAVVALIEKTLTYKVHVDPIRVQESLAHKGYTADVVTDLILDAVEARRQQTLSAATAIAETARKSGRRWLVIGGVTDTGQFEMERSVLAPLLSINVADLSIPQTDMTVGSMARVLRLLMGLPMIELRGDLICPKGDDCAIDDAVLTVRYVEKPGRFAHADIRGYSATLPYGSPHLLFRQQVELVAAQLVKAVDPGSIIPTILTAPGDAGRAPDIDRYVASLPYHKQASHFRALANYRAAQNWPVAEVIRLLSIGIDVAESERDYDRKVEVAAPLYLDRGAISYNYRPKDGPPGDAATAAAVSQARLDFAAAARSKPLRPLALTLRAYTYLRDGRFDLARLDYEQAAQLAKQPEMVSAVRRGLGLIELAQGETHSAIAAIGAANRAYVTSNGLVAMGMAHLVNGSYRSAIESFVAAFERVDGDRGYAALLRYAAETMAGDPMAARHLDVALLEQWNPWITILADGMLGRRPDAEILAQTVVDGQQSSGRMTEAAFYLGLRHLIAARDPAKRTAERKAAIELFRRVLQTDNYHFTEWVAAAALFRRLEQAPPIGGLSALPHCRHVAVLPCQPMDTPFVQG